MRSLTCSEIKLKEVTKGQLETLSFNQSSRRRQTKGPYRTADCVVTRHPPLIIKIWEVRRTCAGDSCDSLLIPAIKDESLFQWGKTGRRQIRDGRQNSDLFSSNNKSAYLI